MRDDDTMQLTPEQQRLRTDLKRMRRYRPDPGFQARLRQQFVSGSIDEPPTHVRARRGIRRALFPWILAPAAVAAALLFILLGNQGPSWSLIQVAGEGSILLNGESFAVEPSRDLPERLGSEARLETPDGIGIDLKCGDIAVMAITPGTEVRIPRAPGRWFPKVMSGEVRRGEILVKTGPDFAGNHLLILTPEGRVEIAGTTVSVLCNEELTCVCVLTGKAKIGETIESLETIPSGMRKVMFRDGRPALVTKIAPEHEAGLIEFEQRNRDIFKRRETR